MEKSELVSRYQKVLRIEFQLEEDEMNLEAELQADLDVDEFVLAEFTLELELEFEIGFGPLEMGQCVTLADVLALVEKHVSEEEVEAACRLNLRGES